MDLSKIKSPTDIKSFNLDQLNLLSEELRAVLIRKLAVHGGHVGPNLGVVEATVALHYVFDAPKDKIVFDVSHQSYVHKMLTGRIEAFISPEYYDKVTGYTSPSESEYDLFEVGHTSTSISLATGLAKARDLQGGKENVIAFIGDASLGGGMALEALNYAPELKSNIIVILNDNQMSIAENHGELYTHLKELRDSNGASSNNIFKALGYEYIYVKEGNDLRSLIKAFREAKDQKRAVLVHINTMKGEGLPVAETNKETFHFSAPFDAKTGALLNMDSSETYVDVFVKTILDGIRKDPKLVLLTAGTPGAFGFSPAHRAEAGKQIVDVGIAEQDAVTMSAGLAKGGAHPVMGVVSTFLQRAYDQLSHDVAINNLPASFVVFYGGMFGMNDVTHLGFFDIAMISNIPNITMLAPASAEEYKAMLELAVDNSEGPLVVRTPGGALVSQKEPVNKDFTKYVKIEDGSDVAIIAEGAFLPFARKAAALAREKGVNPMVVNPRILSNVDEEFLDGLKDFRMIVTVEDGIIDGGFGQKVSTYMNRYGVKTINLGIKKEFVDRYDVKEFLKANSLTPEQIAEILVKG
ncbi:MAG: 1-deoxy-D-xylulose-5-phosphate synthase [Bacteroidales bacterium]|nr:1-deoxy-D-xylulose-5-phosphate synthase [Bacteroidales bacterium]